MNIRFPEERDVKIDITHVCMLGTMLRLSSIKIESKGGKAGLSLHEKNT